MRPKMLLLLDPERRNAGAACFFVVVVHVRQSDVGVVPGCVVCVCVTYTFMNARNAANSIHFFGGTFVELYWLLLANLKDK